MNTQTDLAELRRLWEAATKGKWSVEIDEYETDDDGTVIAGEISIPEINRTLHSTEWAESSDWQRDLDNAEFIAAAHNALPALLDELEAAREALSQIYWKSIELGEDRGDSTINHIAADALKGDTSPLHARDRRQKLIGAVEELERIAANWYEEMVAWTATDFEQRAAQLRQEAGDGN